MEPRTLFDYWLVLYRHRLLVLVTIVAATAAAYRVSSELTPQYRAEIVFFVSEPAPRGGILAVSPLPTSAAERIRPITDEGLLKYHAGILESGAIRERVRTRVTEVSDDDLVRDVDVVAQKSRLLKVRARHTDPAIAARVAAAYADALNDFLVAALRDRYDRQLEAMLGVLDEAGAKLDAARERLREFLVKVKVPQANAETSFQEEILRADIHLYEGLVATLRRNYQDLLAEANTQPDQVVVVSEARPPEEPIFPLPIVNTIVASVLGLVGGMYLAFLYDFVARVRGTRP